MASDGHDHDPSETKEWLDSIESVIREEGIERARYLLERLSECATRDGMPLPYTMTTPYRNTIPPNNEVKMPGDLFLDCLLYTSPSPRDS